MSRRAITDHPIHDLVAQRWSPRAFADRDVPNADLATLFEAARWAPSCFGEEPWRFLVATRADAASFERIASTLVEGNAWARKAPVLAIAVAKATFTRNDTPNGLAWHDVGIAVGQLGLQARALGLAMHCMGGFDGARAREVLSIPPGFDPVEAIAIGYEGDPASLPEPLRSHETAPRKRRTIQEILFGAAWEQPFGS